MPFPFKNIQYFDQQPLNKYSHHNKIGISFNQFEELIQLLYQHQTNEPISTFELSNQETNTLELEQLFHHLIINPSNQVIPLKIQHHHDVYFIPPKSKFIMSDLKFINQCLIHQQSSFNPYDIIIMDPPWFNHSIKRIEHYKGQDKYKLLDIQMNKLLHSQGILAIWITNQPTIYSFVINKLLPRWKFKLIGKWYWVKVTTQGELVIPSEHSERRPYEILLLATHSSNIELAEIEPRIIYSVPFQYHSRKPHLVQYFKDLINYKPLDKIHQLELFGRYLSPNCTTWGNEVIKFQHQFYLT